MADPAVEWLESVAMRPMLESLLEAVCKDKPNDLLNYAIAWMRTSYPTESAEAATAAQSSGEWTPTADVEVTPEGLMSYLKNVNATVVLEGIIERAIRATPTNVVAFVIDDLAGLRSGEERPSHVMDPTPGVGNVVAESVSQAAQGTHPRVDELFEAIGDGDVERAEKLLQDGVSADCKDPSSSQTALMVAAEGELECLQLLLKHGADVNGQNKMGETALMAAIKYSDHEIIKLLVDAGTDPKVKDMNGMTAADHAKEMNMDAEILELFDKEAAEQVRAKGPPPEAPRKAGERRASVSSESVDPKKQVDLSTIPQHAKTAEQEQRIEAAISGNLLFSALDAATRKALILSMTERNVAAGDAVITQGEDGDFFYIVDSGTLDCFVKADGVEAPGKKVVEYVSGMSFGELALMYNTPRAATIIAQTDSCLFAIERDVFRSLILSAYMGKRNRFEQILSTVPLLTSMSSNERAILADAFDEVTFDAGAIIIKEGEQGSSFYILLDGECSAKQDDAEKVQKTVKTYKSGEYFGEVALVKGDVRQATVQAETECKCIVLDKLSFERLLGPVQTILQRDAENYAKHV